MIHSSIILVTSLLIACLVTEFDGHVADPPRVLLISFDGFRWDYLQKTNNTENFQKIIRNGVLSKRGLKNAFVTKTFPNHYTLVTGMYEESHGIVGNTFFDPVLNRTFELWNKDDARDWRWFDMGAEPIWVTNQKQGCQHRSGSVFWPGSAASVDGIYATRYLLFDSTFPFKSRVDKIIEWLNDDYSINLGLLYFEEPDHTGHVFGPDSVQMAKKIGELDDILGYLLQQLEKYEWINAINVIITSDHGMTDTHTEDKINLDDYIRLDSYTIFNVSPIADIHPISKELEDEIYKNLSSVPHLTVYKKDEIPLHYHYSHNRRIAPILAVADEHYWISHNNSKGLLGDHGYNNSLPSMHPFFIGMGPAFKKNASVEILNNVDVYPLICHILKLKPVPNNGSLDVVKYLFAEPNEIMDTSTVGIYILIIVCTGCVSGIFCVVACLIKRTNGFRQLRSTTDSRFSKLDSIPLMVDLYEDDLDVDP